MSFRKPIAGFYKRFEHRISSLFLLLGFILDALTLQRADKLFENLWIAGYLVIIAVFIMLVHVTEKKGDSEGNMGQAHFWYVNILQFAFGGVFSAFLVLYFRSADIFSAWPFIALLALIFIANEFIKKHYIRLSFQISLFFLAIYSFTIFSIPVILHKMGAWIFLLSGLISLILIWLFIKILFRFTKDKLGKSKKLLTLLILSIFALVNFLYFTNVIPPIPLSLKDAGMYHTVHKTDTGYIVTYEDHGFWNYFNSYPDFHKTPESSVYAFSAIFSPKDLDMNIRHEWQHYDEIKKKWTTESVIKLPIIGGRVGGFRTYSKRTNIESGKWRVNIQTEQGKNIGRLRFTIVSTDIMPPLKVEVKLK